MHLLAPIPWAQRVWALPFFTVLAPSERYAETHGRRHKRLTDWARQMIRQVRRWVPHRQIVVVADSSYAAFDLLASCQRLAAPVTMITRLRLDARLFEPAPVRLPGTVGRPRQKGARLPTLAQRLHDVQTRWESVTIPWYGRQNRYLEVATDTAVWFLGGHPAVPMRWVLIRDPEQRFAPQALLCTDQVSPARQIIAWFVRRWQMEVTFHDVREHLGVETQRQWSDLAIGRTTPGLLGLYSRVTLMAHVLTVEKTFPLRRAAWYDKQIATFSDTLALVRQHLWLAARFYLSPEQPDVVKIPRVLFQRMVDTLAYAP